MTLETIMRILYANDLTDVIVTATAIDNNIQRNLLKVGDFAIAEVNSNNLKSIGKKFKKETSCGYIPLLILAVNEYRMKCPYLVQLPNGETRWVESSSTTPHEIVDIEPVVVTSNVAH